jgi:hypothetical protein
LTESGDGVCLASDVGNVVASFLDHPLLAMHRAAPPAYILGALIPSDFVVGGKPM